MEKTESIEPVLSTKPERERMFLYVTLMNEIRFRFIEINRLFENKAEHGILPVYECCFLQIRMICELVAMSCLVAHGEMSKKLMDTYEADKILKAMQVLKPHFFPQPISVIRNGKTVDIKNTSADAKHLTRQEFVRLWSLAGDALHAGPLSKHVKALKEKTEPDMRGVVTWAQKAADLLSSHMIALGETKALVVALNDEETGGPKATIMNMFPSDGTMHIESFAVQKKL